MSAFDASIFHQQYAEQQSRLLARDAAYFSRLDAQLRAGKRLDLQRLERDWNAAQLRAENRARLIPAPEAIEFPPELPVTQAREELAAAIAAHQVVLICGETGSGKTTQLPKICLALGRGRRGLIGHTQPRRLAARSVASRIAQEMKSPLGGLVGYDTRFDRRVSEATVVKLMTDGILLAELQRDRELLAYDTIIIDEAHERSLNIDFLLGWLRRLLPRRPDLKVVITSATLDPERLAGHFGRPVGAVSAEALERLAADKAAGKADERAPVPILKVEGRTYPVQIRYRPPEADEDLETQVAEAISELWRGGRDAGDTLVFLPGEREIRDLAKSLPGRFPRAEVLPLYSRLPAAQQDRVFQPGRMPRIVLSTNVAETSVTVPGIRFVVDTGTARINRFSPRLGVQLLQIEAVAQSAANQRAGRCGRVAAGVCMRLYPEDDFKLRAPFTDPEILRSNLAGVILQMAGLGLGDVDHFPWVDEPEHRHVTDGYRLLQTLGALDDDRQLTALGRELARLPLDPRIARIALAARGTPAAHAVWVLAASLSVQDPHDTPPDQQTQARQKHAEWRHPRSDFLTRLQLWSRWQSWGEQASNRALRKICREHYVSYLRMEEWEAVYRQIADMLEGGKRDGRNGGDAKADARVDDEAPDRSIPQGDKLESLYPVIHKALAAGLIDHIGYRLPAEKNQRPEYQGPRSRKFRIFPGSALIKKSPSWLLCAELAQTSRLFARVCADVQPEWLAEVGDHLVKRTVTHPVWNPERGEVQCTEYHSLFGLQLVKRNRHYGSFEPVEARRIFITEALVRGNWPQKPRFLTDNLRLIADIQDKEARLRRPDLLGDEDQIYAFYDARIPADVCTAANLKSWLRRASADRGDPGRLLRMQEDDVLRPGADADVDALFPDELDVGGHVLDLSYQHDPGEDADGVSFHIPLSLLYQLPASVFDYLVPGLRAARIEALIRGLPMHLRRQCTPAGEYAAALASRMQVSDGDFLESLCAHFRQMSGVQLKPEDFEPGKLPTHLRPRLVLEDLKGKPIAEGASLPELQRRYAEPARQALSQSAESDDAGRQWVRSDVRDWNFGDLPASVSLKNGALGYPALAAEADGKVALKLLESPEAAAASHADGVRALLLLKLADRMKDLNKTAKSRLGLQLIGQDFVPETLARQVAERAAAVVWNLPGLRTEAAFKDAVQHRGDFGREAIKRLDDVIGWFQSAAELRKRMRALKGQWAESLSDLQKQVESLCRPALVMALPEAQWSRVQVWLRAATVRLDRLPNKPQRDIELLQQIRAVAERLPEGYHEARWLLEEWRVALFAQELRAVGSPRADRILALADLR